MTRRDFYQIQEDAKKWRKLKEEIEVKCQYSGAKSMLMPVLDMVKGVENDHCSHRP